MLPSILVIHGVTQTGEWYLANLKKSAVLGASKATLKLVDFDYGVNPKPIIEALDSGDHAAAIVCDLSIKQDEFTSLLGSALTRFVSSNGGRLAFPTTEGLLLLPVLKRLFHVPWEIASYHSDTWGPRQDASAKLDITFPIHNFLPQSTRASKLSFCAKACLYKNVRQEDRCYAAEQCDDEDVSEECKESEVIVAIRNCGAGKICYFGDVNAGKETLNLIFAFCLA